MAMGKRRNTDTQGSLWLTPDELPQSMSHPFYRELNAILAASDFDRVVEALAEPYYAEGGRPSLPPTVYVRILLVGYFEGIDSERGLAWRLADSIALRSFLGLAPTARTPDHSTISRTRRRLPREFHEEVFAMVVQILADHDLVDGKTIGVDGSTMEANAAMRSIVRRDNGASYQEFLDGLAREAGIEAPSRDDLSKMDRKRKGKKTSNKDWVNPHDPDAKVAKMKDGRTRLAFKPEHAVDMSTEAVLAAEIHPADRGDTQTFPETVDRAVEMVDAVIASGGCARAVQEVVADKGMHSGGVLVEADEKGLRTYISEPDRGRRNWRDSRGRATDEKTLQKQLTYANRRRIKGGYGRALMAKRGELIERGFAHTLDTGGMRRTTLRGLDNIAKRYLVHVAGYNLSLIMRKLFGAGKPRHAAALAVTFQVLLIFFASHFSAVAAPGLDRAASASRGSSTLAEHDKHPCRSGAFWRSLSRLHAAILEMARGVGHLVAATVSRPMFAAA